MTRAISYFQSRRLLSHSCSCLILALYFYLAIPVAHADECKQLQHEINVQIEAARFCVKDSDCIAEQFSCPFGCETVLNRGRMNDAKAKIERYEQLCEVCEYKCAVPVGEIRCVERKCTRAPSGSPRPLQ